MSYRFRFFILCILGVCYSQQISAVPSCLEAFNGGLKARILNNNGSVREEYMGMDGYALFSEKETGGKMLQVFINVSSVLDKAEFERLGWQQFQGTVPEFRAFRNKILNNNGSVREEYVGMEGYAFFAEKETEGKMQKAFQNVSSVLDKAEFERLGWQGFRGTVSEFRAFRNKILNKDGSVREGFAGMEGYAFFAEDRTEGKMPKAFQNVSSVLDKLKFADLVWQAISRNCARVHGFPE